MNRAASPRVSSKAPGPPVGAITRASLQEKSGSPGLAIFALSRLKGRRGRCLPFRRHAFLQLRPQQGERPIARADYGRPRADLTLSARAFGQAMSALPASLRLYGVAHIFSGIPAQTNLRTSTKNILTLS